MKDFLEGLNAQQREAVMINDGSLLVFAGAGSGKTRVITTKIAYSIQNLGIKPWQILAVTFTNKACREMQDRVTDMIGDEAVGTVIKTFHSFGVWLLRKYWEEAGLSKNFKIYDEEDSAVLLQQCFPNENKKDLIGYCKKISILKDKMEKPDSRDDRLCKYYAAYQSKLRSTGNVDFADMITISIKLLRENSEIKDYIHNRFKVILVDEYQDSNKAQFLLLKELVGPATFVCVVGDDDQSIYRFRGAEVKNILSFPEVFPNTKTVVLGRNYRCTKQILDAASDVICRNCSRAKKELVAEHSEGMIPQLYYVNSDIDEARKVAQIIKEKGNYGKTAVLYRTNAQSKAFEDQFMFFQIPYHLVGALRFYDREEIKDCIALISLIINPKDSVSFQRMINKPARSIGDVSVQKLLDISLETDGDVIEASKKAVANLLVRGAAVSGVENFLSSYASSFAKFGDINNSELLKFIIQEFGLLDYYIKRDKEEHNVDNARVDNINQLVNMLSSEVFSDGIEGINNFLEYIALDPSSLANDSASGKKSDEGVTLITMHNTKGLEFDRVFVTGMEQEIFPGNSFETTLDDLEEERRICYVAFTRARYELYILSANSRMKWGHVQYETPSQFIKEIKPNHIEEHDSRESRTSYWAYSGKSASKYNKYESKYDGYTGNYKGNYDGVSVPKYPQQTASPYLIRPKATLIKAQSGAKSIAEPVVSSVAGSGVGKPVNTVKFVVGDRIHSDAYGNGSVTNVRTLAGREVIDIKFDNGKQGSFASGKTTFTKITD